MPRLMTKAEIAEAFHRWHAANPNPVTELEYDSPFQLLVAVVMSAQATDKGVNIATRKLFPVAPTPEAMATLGEAGINIATFHVGRETAGGNAVALIEIDGDLPADVLAKVRALPQVQSARPLKF